MQKLSTTSTANVQEKTCGVGGTSKRKQTQVTDKKIRQLKLVTYASGCTYGHLCFSHLTERYSIGLGCVDDVGVTVIRDLARRLLADCYSQGGIALC